MNEIEYLILDNATRDKTIEQKGREAKTLLEIEKVKAKERQGERTDLNIVAVLPLSLNAGKSRDAVSSKVGLRSGREVERAIKTVEIIDELFSPKS